MNNGDMPAAPTWELNGQGVNEMTGDGLTKREAFAMAAMQGLIERPKRDGAFDYTPQKCARDAVYQADALLAELEKSNEH